jgi:hypothetical protein
MRYYLSINNQGDKVNRFDFENTKLNELLSNKKSIQVEPNIFLTTICYSRENPGLIESNWGEPFFNDSESFIFIGGSILNRNNKASSRGPVPSPKEVLELIKGNKYIHDEFKGNYYLVYYNKLSKVINVYSSVLIMHPAYYSNDYAGEFVFSNSLVAFSKIKRNKINKQAILEHELFDHSVADKTLYEGVIAIEGGMKIEIISGNEKKELIYDITKWFTKTPIAKKESLLKIKESLDTSLGYYINKADRFNISLTGGFDGRLNFSFIKKEFYSKLRAVSYGLKGSKQIKIPSNISNKLKFSYSPIFFDEEFNSKYSSLGNLTIELTGGVTGFNRAVYPYAYSKIASFSRSCIIGQCDMIRPLFGNPAGIIINKFNKEIFYGTKEKFIQLVKNSTNSAFIKDEFFYDEIIGNIYDEVKNKYIDNYKNLTPDLQFYFYLLKESLMKYWQTEFHIVDLFIDDYVSFADLDYLELLFKSEYAGLYKGLFATNQIDRKNPHDLYIDLMTLNNNKLNYFFNDRYFMPGWLKFGKLGWIISGAAKKIGRVLDKGDDTFNAKYWTKLYYESNIESIKEKSLFFDVNNIENAMMNREQLSIEDLYKLNRAISLKYWLNLNNVQK